MSSLNYPASLKIFIFFFLALGILQIPFLTADADINLGASRGPWTDEGMYTMQVRNALLTGTIDINETDGLIKEPLFSVMAFAILGGIDNSMTAMRSAGLAYCCFMLALLASGENPFSYMLRICIPIGFLSYYPLQYSHLAMVEMSACVSVLLSIFFIYMRLTGGGIWNLYLASVFALIAYAFKIQFVYVAIIPPLAVLINLVLKKVLRSPIAYQDWIDFLILLLLSGIFLFCFILVWIVPNWDLFVYVMTIQSSGRIEAPHRISVVILKNLIKFITDWRMWPIGLLFICGIYALAFRWHEAQKVDKDWAIKISLLAPTSAWLIVEAHKISFSYLPSRYLVSLLLACSLVGATALFSSGESMRLFVPTWVDANLFPGSRLRIFSREMRLVKALFAVALLINLSAYLLAISSRTYVIFDAQNILLKEKSWAGKTVVGAWAASLFWGSDVITKPVWTDYFNDRNIIERFDPVAIVMEPDQEDSAQALARDGIILPSQPFIKLRIKNWDVYIYDLGGSGK